MSKPGERPIMRPPQRIVTKEVGDETVLTGPELEVDAYIVRKRLRQTSGTILKIMNEESARWHNQNVAQPRVMRCDVVTDEAYYPFEEEEDEAFYGPSPRMKQLVQDYREAMGESAQSDTVKFTPQQRLYTYDELCTAEHRAMVEGIELGGRPIRDEAARLYDQWERQHRRRNSGIVLVVFGFGIAALASVNHQPEVLAGAAVCYLLALLIRFLIWLVRGQF